MIYSAVKCDKCGSQTRYTTFVGATLIKKWSREEGWSFGKQGDLCPICKKNEKEAK